MKLEHKVFVVPIDQNMQDAVNNLEKDGWKLRQDVPPVAVYHLWKSDEERPHLMGNAGFGRLALRDDLITVLGPDGKPK